MFSRENALITSFFASDSYPAGKTDIHIHIIFGIDQDIFYLFLFLSLFGCFHIIIMIAEHECIFAVFQIAGSNFSDRKHKKGRVVH